MAKRDTVARGTEIGGSVVAGGVGSMLGAAKLRDSYKEDYPRRFEQGAKRAHHAAGALAPKTGGKLARLVSHGKPGFVPLAVGTAAAAAATGAKKYRKHREPVGKSAFGIDHDIAKGLRSRGNQALAQIDSADTTVRQVRRKVAPGGMRLAAIADSKARQAITNENAKLAKGDPEGRLKRRERAAELGLGAGAGTAGFGAARSVQAARKRASSASSSASLRDRSFQSARMHGANVVSETGAHAMAMKARHGKGVSSSALRDTNTGAKAMTRNLEAGLGAHTRALHSAHEATSAFRHGRRLGVAAAGLGAGALFAHNRASGHNR